MPAKAKPTPSTPSCPLNGKPAVYPEIPPQADVLLIGYAPGRTEVVQRRPFVGPSGTMLRAWTEQAGLQDRAGFANVELHRVTDSEGRNRNPTREEVLGCLPVLYRTIAMMQPKALVCVGDVPARVFGFTGRVHEMVGRWSTYQLGEQAIPVACIWHPAYLLRQAGRPEAVEKEHDCVRTLKEVRRYLEGQEVAQPTQLKQERTTSLKASWGRELRELELKLFLQGDRGVHWTDLRPCPQHAVLLLHALVQAFLKGGERDSAVLILTVLAPFVHERALWGSADIDD